MKRTLKRILPEPLWNAGREAYDALRRLPDLPGAYLHPWRRDSIRRLREMKDIHRGERCFIIGNGPSLRETDLAKLRGQFTFGMNRIYLLFPELGFPTTYFVSTNDLVIEQCREEIMALPMPKFLAWRSRRFFTPGDPSISDLPIFLHTTYTGAGFASNTTGRLWEGATVTFISLQLAFHMGFSEVNLVGVDHSFVTQGEANSTITSQGDDPNHFTPGYFGKGFRWQLPDLVTSERAYRMARTAFEADGRHIQDATIGGKLTVFPRVDYTSLFS